MTSPREVFDRLSEGISQGRWDELSALYAEDAVIEHPQRVPRPTRLEGRKALHEHFTGALAASVRLKRHDVVVHETTDPEVIVAEYKYTAESIATGKSAEVDNVQVVRVRDGLIVHTRDYHDYLRLTALQDALDTLPAAFEQAPPRELLPPAERPPLSPAGTPRGVLERLVYGIADRRWVEIVELYGEKTYVTHPFHPSSTPHRTREEIREHFAMRRLDVDLDVRNLVTYQGTDPEILIAEFDYQGTLGASKPTRVSQIFVMRIRDGVIIESHDYGDHLGVAGDTGRLPEFFARLNA